jgi:putative flippase GtrA
VKSAPWPDVPVEPAGREARAGGPPTDRDPPARTAGVEARSAGRAAVSSVVATLTDGAVYQIALFATARAGQARYGVAAFMGAVAGGVTNFALNRHWAFRAQGQPLFSQATRYAIGSIMTLLVLEATLFVLVDRLGFDARAAWLPAKLLAWVAFSYPFQRMVVFAGGAR